MGLTRVGPLLGIRLSVEITVFVPLIDVAISVAVQVVGLVRRSRLAVDPIRSVAGSDHAIVSVVVHVALGCIALTSPVASGVSGSPSRIITSAIAMPVTVPVASGAPIAKAIGMETPTHPSKTDAKREAPARDWIVMDPKTKSDRSWVVIVAVPGPVVIARSVDHDTTVDIRIGITW